MADLLVVFDAAGQFFAPSYTGARHAPTGLPSGKVRVILAESNGGN
jgi:hypothetical protein